MKILNVSTLTLPDLSNGGQCNRIDNANSNNHSKTWKVRRIAIYSAIKLFYWKL